MHQSKMAQSRMGEPAKLTVAIDFGTTYSGFSYVEGDPSRSLDNVHCFEAWPSQGRSQPYCKTQTSLLYVQVQNSRPGVFELLAWGWTAFLEHCKLVRESPQEDGKKFHFIRNFKLALAVSKDGRSSYSLPEGFTAQRVVSDYLQQMSSLIVNELQETYGRGILKKDIQWCLTVPAIWDNTAKEQMRRWAEMAGLVDGPLNAHGEASVIIVLEPEAALGYCLRTCQKNLPPGSKILVVDAGGGTVDLTLHELVNSGDGSYQVQEINCSSGDLCGAKFVDDAFFDFLRSKIGCFDEFLTEMPAAVLRIRQAWEVIKVCFDGARGPYRFPLLGLLSKYWEQHDDLHGMTAAESNYNEVVISQEEMKRIFDTVLHRILQLIQDQLRQVAPEDAKSVTIMVVGGFSASPYLIDRIKSRFRSRVGEILNPVQPGKAVVKGALIYGRRGTEMITSRIARQTYGMAYMREFRRNDPESNLFLSSNGLPMCKDAFHIYVRKGDRIPVDYNQKVQYLASIRDNDCIKLEVYTSTDSVDPDFVTAPGITKECTLTFPIPSREIMTEAPIIEVSMYFGRATIEVTAVGLNFRSTKMLLPTLTFEPRGELRDAVLEPPVVDKVEVISKSCCTGVPGNMQIFKPEDRCNLKELAVKVDERRVDVGTFPGGAVRDAVREAFREDMAQPISQIMRELHATNEIIHHQIRGLEKLTVAIERSSFPRLPYLLQGTACSTGAWKASQLFEGKIQHAVRLHFFCEAHHKDSSMHAVVGQEGIDMKILKRWVKTVAPYLVLSLTVVSMVAKLVAMTHFPPIALLLPSDWATFSSMVNVQNWQDSRESLSNSISTFLDNYDEPIGEGQCDREELRKARAGFRDCVEQLNHLDFETKVALERVAMKDCHGTFTDVKWICNPCLREYQKVDKVKVLGR